MTATKGGAPPSTKEAPKREGEKEKVMVPRKKLQSVPDLLASGDKDSPEGESESFVTKLLWMAFLLLLFYVSLELFLRVSGAREGGASSEL
ncbi:hypothetical protein ACHAWF_014506 [Thalassiosira exigua]